MACLTPASAGSLLERGQGRAAEVGQVGGPAEAEDVAHGHTEPEGHGENESVTGAPEGPQRADVDGGFAAVARGATGCSRARGATGCSSCPVGFP